MNLSDLQVKDIISKDGKRLGKIIDARINLETGTISYLVVENRRILKNIVNGNKDFNVDFKQIIKIGEDVILVDMG